MTFQELAQIVQKKQKTVEVFFSRKNLSIENSEDISKYLEHHYTGKQWRTSTYSAPHLRKYHFRKLVKRVSPRIPRKFPRVRARVHRASSVRLRKVRRTSVQRKRLAE